MWFNELKNPRGRILLKTSPKVQTTRASRQALALHNKVISSRVRKAISLFSIIWLGALSQSADPCLMMRKNIVLNVYQIENHGTGFKHNSLECFLSCKKGEERREAQNAFKNGNVGTSMTYYSFLPIICVVL